MKLTVEKTRIYGVMGGYSTYRASVGGDPIATAKLKAEAHDKAIAAMYSAWKVSGNPPEIAALNDGRILVGTELNSETFALFYLAISGAPSYSSSFGQRSIDGKPCSLRQYVKYHALMYDGMDWLEAAKQAMG